jgi:glycosyltransferase involved in cell wall biosynthesis
VVLTNALERWLRAEHLLGERTHVEVIPCCVDTTRFSPDEASRREAREELGVGDRLVLLYSGSLGSWYLEAEMAKYAAHVRREAEARGKKVVVVVLSPSAPDAFRAQLDARGFGGGDVVVQKVPPARMARLLRAGDVGMSFIQSCFSKKGSSPTKVAEYLASGLVVTLNGDIGDQADLAVEEDACVVIEGYADDTLAAAAKRAVDRALVAYAERSQGTLRVARSHFGLAEVGVPRYERLYRALSDA